MDALQYLDKLKAVDIPVLASEVLSRHTNEIADRNADQLARGLSSDGKPTTLNGKPNYAPLTIQLKRQRTGLAAVTSVITGFDTGSMYKNLYAQVQGSKVEYGSTSATAKLFEAKASNRVFGLTEENREELAETKLKPELKQEIENRLK